MVSLIDKVRETGQTPLLIAGLCGSKETVRALQRVGIDLIQDDAYEMSSHDLFVEMLNREFPSGLRIEESSLKNPLAPGSRQRRISPGSTLPRRCGISE